MSRPPRLTPEQKRERDRQCLQRRRRAAGAIPLELWRANSLRAIKPWLKLGLSERQWYARGQPMREVLAPNTPRRGERLQPPADQNGDTQ
jgi:hypothetical protein